MVDAGVVLFELVRGNRIAFHVRGVRMTPRAGLGDIEGIHFRMSITRGAQVMHAMAIRADRDFRVALGEKLAMDAYFVLAELVRAQGRIVLAHERWIRMAPAAKLWNLSPFDLATETCCLAHGVHICFRGITAMATGTGQSILRMDVVGKLFLGHLERWVQRGMTIHARAHCLRVGDSTAE
jgi:hypothetical protein